MKELLEKAEEQGAFKVERIRKYMFLLSLEQEYDVELIHVLSTDGSADTLLDRLKEIVRSRGKEIAKVWLKEMLEKGEEQGTFQEDHNRMYKLLLYIELYHSIISEESEK